MKLLRATDFVLDHEPCLGLREVPRQSPDSSGVHRYRIITVIRNDEEVEFEQDLGLSEKFKSDGFIIPGGFKEKKGGVIVHNVGELQKIADQLNGRKLWNKQELTRNNNIREKY